MGNAHRAESRAVDSMTWLLAVISLAGNYLNSTKRISGFYIWIACNTGWLIYDIANGIYARAILDIVQTAFCVLGIIKWQKG